jgi:MFS transporter, MHS family, shikimate and dehydroshikimate transport protein
MSKKEMNLIAVASLIGSAIEWYDWFLYGTAASLVFNKLFFPNFDPLIGTLLAFVTFGVGFLARPLGGIIFGHYGDKLGRKSTLIICLLIMGLCTVLIGCLPTYSQIGTSAAVLLVVLRAIQGIAVGGEWGGAVLLTLEHSPDKKRGFYGSLPQLGVPVGLILSTVVFSLFNSSMSSDAFISWGWRFPFLLSIILVITGLVIRLKISETPAFVEAQKERPIKAPLKEVWRKSKKDILLVLGTRFANDASYYVSNTFALMLATKVFNLSSAWFLSGITFAAIVELFAIPFFGSLTDKIGRRPVFMSGCAFFIIFAFPFFWLLQTQNMVLIWIALILWIAVGHGATFAPMASFIAERFDTETRYTGSSLSYQLSGVFVGGPTPFLATWLFAQVHSYYPVALFVMLLGAIGTFCVYKANETYKRDIYQRSVQG